MTTTITLFIVLGLAACGLVFLLVFAGVLILRLGQRFDRAQRRRAYETEYLVKSIEALDKHQAALQQRVNALAIANQRLTAEVAQLRPKRETTTEEEPASPVSSGRLLH